jgi:hypothetical protein
MRAITVFESQNFTRTEDIKTNMGIGMWGQIHQICQNKGRNFDKKNLLQMFLTCASEDRIDLMDFILSRGLDINGSDSEILRVLGWMEKVELGAFLIVNRGADVEKAIRISQNKHEWKTERRLEEMKELIKNES